MLTRKAMSLLLSPMLLVAVSTTASACEHCRAAAAAAAAQAAAQTNPTDLTVVAIQSAGCELRQAAAARKQLVEQSEKLGKVRADMQRELQTITAELEAIRAHVQAQDYPLVISCGKIGDEETATKCASTLLSRHDSLTSSINQISQELEAGDHDLLQVNGRIQQLETEILLAETRAKRIIVHRVPQQSERQLRVLRATVPAQSPESQRRQRLTDFLNEGVPPVKVGSR